MIPWMEPVNRSLAAASEDAPVGQRIPLQPAWLLRSMPGQACLCSPFCCQMV
jgi:hypothetical protein